MNFLKKNVYLLNLYYDSYFESEEEHREATRALCQLVSENLDALCNTASNYCYKKNQRFRHSIARILEICGASEQEQDRAIAAEYDWMLAKICN
jgi:hypothetical protein